MMLKPYYQDAAGELYLGDALDVLPQFYKGTADLLLTDPPYGVSWESARRGASFGGIQGDSSLDCGRAGIVASLRVLRGARHLYVFGPPLLDGLPVSIAVQLVWDKNHRGLGNLASPWGSSHELIYFAVKGGGVGREGGRLSARLRKDTVLRFSRKVGVAVRHPTEKPVPLLRVLIESSSCIGERVLDPFTGVGSTLVAAKLEGRLYTGIEIEERWCEIAAERLSKVVYSEEA